MTTLDKLNNNDLSSKFYEWAFENRQLLKPTVPALYFYLIEVCKKLGYKEQFSISPKECMEGMGVSSYNTYKSAFDILCDHGFVTIIKKSCNHYQANIITLPNCNYAKLNDSNVEQQQKNNDLWMYDVVAFKCAGLYAYRHYYYWLTIGKIYPIIKVKYQRTREESTDSFAYIDDYGKKRYGSYINVGGVFEFISK